MGWHAEPVDFTGALTVREAAEILQITTYKAYDLLHRGELPHISLGRHYRIGRYALWCFINRLSVGELAGTALPQISSPRGASAPTIDRTGRRRQAMPFSPGAGR
ncbi:MAG: helix-turn-helix domain-containing protein [Acidobacteriia bacterium]|nr:helix-turn-helix domain-containing protein [Terriglobia bacterium]